jgi:hypothetical protein
MWTFIVAKEWRCSLLIDEPTSTGNLQQADMKVHISTPSIVAPLDGDELSLG